MGEKEIKELAYIQRNERKLMDDSFLFDKGYERYRKVECKYIPEEKPQKYTSTTPVEKKSGNKKNKKNKKKRKAKWEILLLGGALIVFGSIKGCKEYTRVVTLEEAINSGMTLEELGIDENIKNNIYAVKEQINKGNLTLEEKIKLADKIADIEIDVASSKIAAAFNTDQNNVFLIPRKVGENNERVVIEGIGTYEYDGEDKTISKDISDYILRIVTMQGMAGDMEVGIERGDFYEIARESINENDKFAAGQIKVDENGNITIEMRRKNQLAESKEEIKADLTQGEGEPEKVEQDDDYDR